MKPLTRADLRPNAAYAAVREQTRADVIDLKARRRLHVGPCVSLVFENRETLSFQIQEMMRVEHIESEGGIQAELDTYNTLMPGGSDLSATCFIEITDQARIEALLGQFIGLDKPGAMALRLSHGRTIGAAFEAGRSEADGDGGGRISAVHYVRFPFTREDIAWWRSNQGEAFLAVELPRYSHMARIPDAMRRELARDFDHGPA